MDALHLHEVIDIVGEQAVPYMEGSVLRFQEGTADRGLALWGTWYVVGGTGRWPQVVNVWEMADGWAGWERLCRATNLRREANAELADWWHEAYRRRSGGFDRLLRPTAATRTLADLAQAPVRGTLFVHELTEVRPGAGPDYLAALEASWAPVAAEHGHVLVGSWSAVMNDTEVCTVWATSLEDHVALGRAATGAGAPLDDRVAAWRATARTWTTRWREELMVPCPGTPMGPDAWEGTAPG